MAYVSSQRRVLHDLNNIQPHCNCNIFGQQEKDLEVVVLAVKSGFYHVCQWCIGPARTLDEAEGLLRGTIKREDLVDA